MVAKAIITDKQKINTVLIEDEGFLRSTVLESRGTVLINEVLPFRIRFTDIRIPGYNENNIPGIGLQIIGYSNYIL
ncbi:MAG: hypothetical protein EBW15_08785 [Actinobacteria bacterium]|nr:hypothetical protein [Actinomycetota bacterium]